MFKKILCWFKGHDWAWIYDDEDFQHYTMGNCKRCGELGFGKTPIEPEHPEKEHSEGITRTGF